MLKPFRLVMLILLLAIATVETQEVSESIDISSLAGKWRGAGEIVLPMTDIALDIDGDAEFIYDSSAAVLRTYLNASKMMFNYSDSGKLVHNSNNDSVSWEIWNNLGRYSRYTGRLEGDKVVGIYPYRKSVYRFEIAIVDPDSLTFKLSLINDKGERTDKANLHLWRVE